MQTKKSLPAGIALVVLACTSGEMSTGPAAVSSPASSGPPASVAANTWTAKAPHPGVRIYESTVGVAPSASGGSVVYLFGGTDGEGTGFGTRAYDVASDTWLGWRSEVSVYATNGVGRIGRRLYLSGGYNEVETPSSFSNLLWAYDHARDRLVPRAPLPIYGAEGVTGVIDGKLYVLPGACSGDRWPNPGYCEVEPTRRFFRYDPASNAWVSRRQAPHVHRQGAAAVIGGKLYVAGGFNGFDPVDALDVYDPATNRWRTLAPVPQAGRAIGAALKGRFHVLVGTSHYAYDPAKNRWRTLAPSEYEHDGLVKVQLEGRPHLLAVGGSHGTQAEIPNATELYTP
jgi:hypothetical protein